MWQTTATAQAIASKDSLQDGTHKTGDIYWLSFGLGGNSAGFGALFGFTYARGIESLGIQCRSFGSLESDGSNGNKLGEISAYYGRQEYRGILSRAAFGVGYFWGRLKGDKIHTIAPGVQGEMIVHTSGFGIGVLGSINAAPKFFVSGITLNIYLGKFE